MKFLIIIGAAILAAGLYPAILTIKRLPKGGIRKFWLILAFLTLLFICGYLFYFFGSGRSFFQSAAFIVPLIFFGGSLFVLITLILSLQTIKSVQKIDRLEKENITDPLMGIYNRRYFDKRLHEEFSRAKRYGLPLSIIVIDIDKFKIINDTYGHTTGDAVLKKIGQIVSDEIRDTDLPARYGGDEIVIITSNTNSKNARTLAERIAESVRKEQIISSAKDREKEEVSCTVSIGTAGMSEDISHPEELIRMADAQMYLHKKRTE